MNQKKNDNIKNEENLVGRIKPPTDDTYYEGLYNDLPKEVVELLMKTHPLMEEEEKEEMVERYKTRHTRQLEAEEVKAIRQSKMAEDARRIEEVSQEEHPQNEAEVLIYTPKKEIQPQSEAEEQQADDLDDFEDDLIQLVKHKSKGFGTQNNEEDRNKKMTKAKMEVPKEEQEPLIDISLAESPGKELPKTQAEFKKKRPVRNGTRKRVKKDYSNVDLNKMTTDQNLNEFFDNDVEDSDKKIIFPGGKKVMMPILAACVLVVGVLAFRTVSLTGKLQKANAQLEDLSSAKEENNQLKLQMLTMEEEINKTKTGSDTEGQSQDTEGENVATTGTEGQTLDPGSYDTYTVVEGDIVWDISAKVYGNGAYYTRILEANGLTENSTLKIGQQLKIPKLQ